MMRLLGAAAALLLFSGLGCAALAVNGHLGGNGLIYASTTSPVSYFSPTEPLKGSGAEAHGEACMSSVLGLITTGDAGYDAAYKAALATSGASSLFDVRVDRHFTAVLGLYASSCTELTGRVAR